MASELHGGTLGATQKGFGSGGKCWKSSLND
jgi:hypothetical protein